MLGISHLEHDTAAALVDARGPLAAVEEDKLSRSSATGGVPHLSIDRCLREAGACISRPGKLYLRNKMVNLDPVHPSPLDNRIAGEEIFRALAGHEFYALANAALSGRKPREGHQGPN